MSAVGDVLIRLKLTSLVRSRRLRLFKATARVERCVRPAGFFPREQPLMLRLPPHLAETAVAAGGLRSLSSKFILV